MNKQYAFALFFISLFISQNIRAQEGPSGQGSSHSNGKVRRHEAEHETFAAIQESAKIIPYDDDFCKNAIAKAPTPLKQKIARLVDPRRRAKILPAVLILYGPTGSGKSTLAQIILQRMDMPFIAVAGKKLANEYSNSGSAGIKRIENFAIEKGTNVFIDEIDSVTKNKNKKNINEREDDTPGAFWTMLDVLKNNKLLLIGTTNDVTSIPDALQNRLEGHLYYMPYIYDENQIDCLLTELLNGCTIESEQTKKRIKKQLVGQPIRTIETVIRDSIERSEDRNLEVPIITFADFQSALSKIMQDRKTLNQTPYDKKEIFNYVIPTINAATAIANLYLAHKNHALSVESLSHNKSISAANALHQEQTSNMQAASMMIGAATFGITTATACTLV